MRSKRRRFLQSAATISAGMAFACDADAEEAAAQYVPAAASRPVEPDKPLLLPKLKLGKWEISRLIIGGNPFYGYSHFNRLFSTHMTEWATPERVCEALRRAEHCGINTWQFSHTARPLADLKRHQEAGGKMQFIILSHREMEEDPAVVKELAKLGPIGMVHHGGSGERKRRAGKAGEIKDFLKRVRDAGVLAGLSTHDPEFLEQVQAENWEIDFFMTALFYLTRTAEDFKKLLGTKPLGELYLPEDPPRMCAVIRKTPKPCLAYKVLAAGRVTDTPQQIDQAFRFALDNIKPNDGMIIGMYPRYGDQIRENAERVLRIAGAKASA